MNIVIVPSWFRTKNNQIRGSFFFEQAVALKERGHKVTLIDVELLSITAMNREGFFRGIQYNEEQGVGIYTWKSCALGTSRIPYIFLRITEKKLDYILKKIHLSNPIDIIHAHSFYPAGVICARLANKYGAKAFLTEHYSGIITGKLKKSLIPYLHQSVNKMDGVACVSDFLRREIKKYISSDKKIHVIPNVLNPLFTYKETVNKESFVFVLIGRLISLKRIDKVISAIKKLKDEEYNIKLHILGEGPERLNLEKQIEHLELNNDVTLYGNVTRDRVVYQLAYSDAFILPSAIETFGVVYIEALAIGRPVIATRNGGANEIICDENGILIDVDSQEQLECAMKQIIDNYGQYNLREISLQCCHRYSARSIGKQLEEFYRGINI